MKKLLLLLIMLAIMIGSTSMALYAAAPMIGGGSNAGYALKSDGTVWSWGENSSGQLGDNSTSQRKTPVQVSNLTGVTAIEGGYNTGYALGTGGAVWSWGQNSYGKLGDGTTSQRRTPVQVKGELGVGNLTGVTAIAGGIYNGYALKGGIVWSWGTNSTGALGINKNYSQMSESKVPVQVVNLTGVTAIAAGDSAGYALKSDGTVWAWGDNVYGKLGNGTTNSSLVPVQVSNLSGVTAIASHNFQAYALKSNGTVWAWGSNSTGQLGNGTTTNSSVPVQVSNLTGVTAIVSAGTSAYALKQDGTVWAWGYNYYGSTGNNSNTNYFYVPVQVKDEYGINNLTGVTAIAGGYQTGYALKSNGTVLAWGRNDNGELGNNSTTDSKIPVPVWNLTLSASDTTAPTISFSPTSGNSIYTTGSVTITASDASSVSTLYYKWDSNSYASVVGGTRTVTPPSTGSHTLYAYATDSAGNTSSAYSATYNVTAQDTTSPTISFSPTTGSSIYTTGSVTITASDASSVSTLYYKWDSNSYASVVGGTRTVTPPSTGSHTLYAYATDSPGNTSGVYSATYTVTVQDTTAPTATMTYSKNPAKSGDIVTITATFSEPMATTPIVKIALSGLNTVAAINMTVQNATHYTYAYTVPAGNGTETVALSVGTDVAGNVVVATPTNNTLTIDNTSPANPNISINPTTATNANVTVTITYAADAITKSYNINGGTSNSYTGPFTVSSNCTVNASAADAAGNWSSQVAYVISNIDTTPPTLTITSNPSTSSTNASSITYTFAFSKSVTGFVKGDVVVNIGTVGAFSGSGTTYTLVVTNNGSCTQTVSVVAGVCTDIAGNNNTAGSKSIIIDRTSPIISFNPASGSSIYITDSVIITASDPDDAVSMLYYKWDTDAYTSVTGGTKTVAPPSSGGLCTLYAYATDSNGNTSTAVSATYSVVIPVTLNVPTVFGSGYYDENALLSATGANFADAAYRIYYTTNPTAPTISTGSNPGVGWTDSGVANPMTINSSISISEVIAGTDLSNIAWTYVTFKVWAASSTGDSAIKYTTEYSLTDNPSNVDSYIGKIAHNQILTNGTVIANPNDVSNNIYIDGDVVRYRLELDVLKPSRIKDMNITLDCNLYNDPNIQLQLNSIVLKKGTESPIGSGQYTYALIKDFSGIATDGPAGGTNRYNFLLGNDNGGTPIIIANGIGRYAIEYTGRIKADYSQIATSTVIRNDAQIKVYTGSGLYPNTIEQDRPNRKSYMDTNVSKMVVRYA